MNTTPVAAESARAVAIEEPPPQRLWKLALIGLGPLAAMGVFAVLVALFQHLA